MAKVQSGNSAGSVDTRSHSSYSGHSLSIFNGISFGNNLIMGEEDKSGSLAHLGIQKVAQSTGNDRLVLLSNLVLAQG